MSDDNDFEGDDEVREIKRAMVLVVTIIMPLFTYYQGVVFHREKQERENELLIQS